MTIEGVQPQTDGGDSDNDAALEAAVRAFSGEPGGSPGAPVGGNVGLDREPTKLFTHSQLFIELREFRDEEWHQTHRWNFGLEEDIDENGLPVWNHPHLPWVRPTKARCAAVVGLSVSAVRPRGPASSPRASSLGQAAKARGSNFPRGFFSLALLSPPPATTRSTRRSASTFPGTGGAALKFDPGVGVGLP